MLTPQIIHGPKAFVQLASEWDELVARAVTNTPFQSLAYQKSWWQNLGLGELYTIAIRDESTRLMAIGCFYISDGVVRFNGCVEETDYLDLIAGQEGLEEAWETILRTLEGGELPHWNALDFCNVPDISPSRIILPELAERRGLRLESNVHEVCPVISLPESFEDYLASLDKKQRHEVRRKLRRANAAGATVSVIGADEDLGPAVDDFLRLLQESTREKGEWLTDARRAMFREVARASLAAGTLQLMFLAVEGQRAAVLFNFDHGGRIWVYNSGLDPNSFRHLSPGIVLTAHAIEQAIANGRHEFDFLRGRETYKYRFGARDTTIHRIRIWRE